MDDLVTRLRAQVPQGTSLVICENMDEAADCIEAQAAEIAHWKSEITRMGDKLVESADRLLAQHAEIARLKAQAEKLDQALAEIIARWDSPKWKDVEPTADVINRARAALADYRGK